MLAKNMSIVEVIFCPMKDWPDDYKVAIGEYLIACSQWEYIYELLWKDLKPSADQFSDRLREADSQIRNGGKNLKDALIQEGSTECLQMRALIEELEQNYKERRDIIVHGFHHIYEDAARISRFATNQEDAIGLEIIPQVLCDNAIIINSLINELNRIRRLKFHPGQNAVAVSARVP